MKVLPVNERKEIDELKKILVDKDTSDKTNKELSQKKEKEWSQKHKNELKLKDKEIASLKKTLDKKAKEVANMMAQVKEALFEEE